MIGAETGKVIGYSVRSKFCKTCDNIYRKFPKVHDCRCYWDGSSKAMESDMVIEMVKKHCEEGRSISTIVADDDTTTISRLKKAVNINIAKKSDRNHVRKNITSSLYGLQIRHRELTTKVIRYVQKSINYILCQNQGNASKISERLDAFACHAFGDHSLCSTSWCSHKMNPKAKYRSLSYGRPLQGIELQKALGEFLDSYKGQSEKLANLGSTQANESFNKTVASKAPKSHFYCVNAA